MILATGPDSEIHTWFSTEPPQSVGKMEGCGGMRRGCTKILSELAGGGRVVKGREGKFSLKFIIFVKFGNYGCGWLAWMFHVSEVGKPTTALP